MTSNYGCIAYLGRCSKVVVGCWNLAKVTRLLGLALDIQYRQALGHSGGIVRGV